MRSANIYVNGIFAAVFTEHSISKYELTYSRDYAGLPVSLSLPYKSEPYEFYSFPAVFDGLLPEGIQLESLLRQKKINRQDHFSQLLAVGDDLVGAITVKGIN